MAKKVIKAKIVALTKNKKNLLETEYNNLQHFLQTGEDLGIYSANKQQAKRYYNNIKPDKEYPISIRNDLIEIKKRNTKLVDYWCRIRVKYCRKLWVAIKPHQSIPNDVKFCESKIIKKKNDDFFVYITIKKHIPLIHPENILAVDLGERVIATVCGSFDDRKPRFYGRNVRGIRRHYSWLRRRLGKKKLLKTIKKIKNKEKRKVNDCLHKISRCIVDQAKQNNALIVLGDLTNIRSNTKGKGKRFNRIVNSMPFYKLSEMIIYKADWEGIPTVKIREHGTSKTCSRCGEIGKRSSQGHFRCYNCGMKSFNADYNGALNILKRALSYMDIAGAVSEPALNQCMAFA